MDTKATNKKQRVINHAAITPSDSAINAYDAIYVGVSGDVNLIPADGSTALVYKSMAVGYHPIATSYIYATSTTATNLIGLFVK